MQWWPQRRAVMIDTRRLHDISEQYPHLDGLRVLALGLLALVLELLARMIGEPPARLRRMIAGLEEAALFGRRAGSGGGSRIINKCARSHD